MQRICLIILNLGLFQLGAAPIVFSDGVFNLANYSAPVTYNPQGISIATSQILAGGNPGEAVQTVANFTSDFTMLQGLIRPSFSYDPSTQGAIASIDASLDKYLDIGMSPVGFTVGGSWILLQGGNYYRLIAPAVPLGAPSYTTYQFAGSKAADWNLTDFATGVTDSTMHPNFSTSGGLIQFGYTFRLSLTAGGATPPSTRWDLRGDNLSYAVNQVPEPNTISLTLACGLGLVLMCILQRGLDSKISRMKSSIGL